MFSFFLNKNQLPYNIYSFSEKKIKLKEDIMEKDLMIIFKKLENYFGVKGAIIFIAVILYALISKQDVSLFIEGWFLCYFLCRK
jgi:hypothetical protein